MYFPEYINRTEKEAWQYDHRIIGNYKKRHSTV